MICIFQIHIYSFKSIIINWLKRVFVSDLVIWKSDKGLFTFKERIGACVEILKIYGYIKAFIIWRHVLGCSRSIDRMVYGITLTKYLLKSLMCCCGVLSKLLEFLSEPSPMQLLL